MDGAARSGNIRQLPSYQAFSESLAPVQSIEFIGGKRGINKISDLYRTGPLRTAELTAIDTTAGD